MTDLSSIVFVSSVFKGLEVYRNAVPEVANRLNLDGFSFHVIRVDIDSAASVLNSRDKCYAEISRSQICLCILGSLYGFRHPETDLSISEMEFDYARDIGRDILVFIVDGDMEERQAAFRAKVDNIVTGNFRKVVKSVGEFKYECDQALRSWARTTPAEMLAAEIPAYNSLLLDGITNQLPEPVGELSRTEVDSSLASLSNGDSLLLIGEGGSGKSGVLKAICRQIEADGERLIALAPASFPRGATSLDFIGESLPLGSRSFAGALLDVADTFGPLYIAVDQLERIRGTDLGRILVQNLLTLSANPRITVVAACRTFDAEREEMLKLQTNLSVVRVGAITREEVSDVFKKAGYTGVAPWPLLDLGRNLLLLSLIVELIKKGRSLTSLSDVNELWQSYVESLRSSEGDGAFGRALNLAREACRSPRNHITLDIPFDESTERLIAAGVLVRSRFDQLAFRHEELQFYLFAWDAVRRGETTSQDIGELPVLSQRGVLPHLYQLSKRLGPSHQAEFLLQTFGISDG